MRRPVDWGYSRRGRHLRVGPLLLELSRQSMRGDPRVDGARCVMTRWSDADPDRGAFPIGEESFGGIAVKLTEEQRHRAGWRLTVAWRGRPVARPTHWRIRASGRRLRRDLSRPTVQQVLGGESRPTTSVVGDPSWPSP